MTGCRSLLSRQNSGILVIWRNTRWHQTIGPVFAIVKIGYRYSYNQGGSIFLTWTGQAANRNCDHSKDLIVAESFSCIFFYHGHRTWRYHKRVGPVDWWQGFYTCLGEYEQFSIWSWGGVRPSFTYSWWHDIHTPIEEERNILE